MYVNYFSIKQGGKRLSHWNEPQQKPITIPHVHQWKLDKPQPQMMISRQSLCVVNLLTSFNAPRDNFRIMGFFLLCQWRSTCCGEQGEGCSHFHTKWSRAQLELATEGHSHANQERGTEQPTSCCHNRKESLWTWLPKSHTHTRTSNLTK